eukprot:2009236-Alexandrium_andersonii.AAC.1
MSCGFARCQDVGTLRVNQLWRAGEPSGMHTGRTPTRASLCSGGGSWRTNRVRSLDGECFASAGRTPYAGTTRHRSGSASTS